MYRAKLEVHDRGADTSEVDLIFATYNSSNQFNPYRLMTVAIYHLKFSDLSLNFLQNCLKLV